MAITEATPSELVIVQEAVKKWGMAYLISRDHLDEINRLDLELNGGNKPDGTAFDGYKNLFEQCKNSYHPDPQWYKHPVVIVSLVLLSFIGGIITKEVVN